VAPPWHVTCGSGVGWGAVLGVGEGLGVGLAVATVALEEGDGLAAVGAAEPQAVTNTASAARPFSLVIQEA